MYTQAIQLAVSVETATPYDMTWTSQHMESDSWKVDTSMYEVTSTDSNVDLKHFIQEVAHP